MWGHFKDGVFKVCDEVCCKKRERRSKGDTWWWNEEVKGAVSGKKDAHKAMEKKRRYKSMKGNAIKAMREKADEALSE